MIDPFLARFDVTDILTDEDYDHLKLMQWTGLKDKNGKEIFEGDLITSIYDQKNVHEVVFHKGCFCYELPDAHHIFNEKIIEVIGNIFENRELLDNKKK